MKKHLLFLLTALLSIGGYAQVKFESGYYISNAGQKIEGLIKNVDWENNPTTFEYKASEEAAPKTLAIRSVEEFGVNGKSKSLTPQ